MAHDEVDHYGASYGHFASQLYAEIRRTAFGEEKEYAAAFRAPLSSAEPSAAPPAESLPNPSSSQVTGPSADAPSAAAAAPPAPPRAGT